MHREELEKLRRCLDVQDTSAVAGSTELFQGADIIVSDDPDCPTSNGWSDYTRVITPFCREVSWLIFQLKDIFREELDYMNKYPFYGALAESANAAIREDGTNLKNVLNAMIDRAENIEF